MRSRRCPIGLLVNTGAAVVVVAINKANPEVARLFGEGILMVNFST